MNTIQIIGSTAGILTAISMLPQLIKIIKDKQAKEVSVLMLIVLMSGLALWVVYGVYRDDWPLIITNSFSFSLNLLVLIFRVKYSGFK